MNSDKSSGTLLFKKINVVVTVKNYNIILGVFQWENKDVGP